MIKNTRRCLWLGKPINVFIGKISKSNRISRCKNLCLFYKKNIFFSILHNYFYKTLINHWVYISFYLNTHIHFFLILLLSSQVSLSLSLTHTFSISHKRSLFSLLSTLNSFSPIRSLVLPWVCVWFCLEFEFGLWVFYWWFDFELIFLSILGWSVLIFGWFAIVVIGFGGG